MPTSDVWLVAQELRDELRSHAVTRESILQEIAQWRATGAHNQAHLVHEALLLIT